MTATSRATKAEIMANGAQALARIQQQQAACAHRHRERLASGRVRCAVCGKALTDADVSQ